MAPRILDFNDGFTSSSAPSAAATPASAIAFTPYGTVASTNVQDAIEELIDEKIQEIASTDEAIARFDGVTGDLQDSGVLIDNSNNVTFPAQIRTQKSDVASAATITQLSSAKSFIRITGSTLTDVLGVQAGVDGQIITIHNSCSQIVTFKHEDAGAVAADRIKLVDASDIEVDPDSSVEFIYDSTQSRWVIKSGAGTQKLVGYQEAPVAGVVNGINPNFQITVEPITADSIIVYVDGVARPNTEWSIVGTTITFGGSHIPATGQDVYFFYLSKGTPSPAPPAPTGNYNVEYRTITGGESAAKQLTLVATPNTANQVLVDWISGCAQEYGVDFIVTGSTLDWTGLGLDTGGLTTGDKLRIVYFS